MSPLSDTKESSVTSFPSATPTADQIRLICANITTMLLEKNRKYGDSALDPVKIFHKGDAGDALRVRIDDKLSRINNQQEDEDEDVIDDLIGYLILYKVYLKKKRAVPVLSDKAYKTFNNHHPIL
jgi:hypothetical protein